MDFTHFFDKMESQESYTILFITIIGFLFGLLVGYLLRTAKVRRLRKALKEADGDIDLAIENLRKASGLKAAKKADRTAADGVVAAKSAEDGSYAVLVEVNSETDFAARDAGFLAFVGQVVDKGH